MGPAPRNLPRDIFRASGAPQAFFSPALARLNAPVLFRTLFPIEAVPGDLLDLVRALECSEFADLVLALEIERKDCEDRVERALARLQANDN